MHEKIKHIQETMFDYLVNTGWDKQLRFFVKSAEFEDILLHLMNEVSEGKRFTPPVKDLFRMFQITPFEDVRVVFLVKEPYLDPTLNTGLALAHTQKTTTVFPFLAMINELEKTVGNHHIENGDLSHWAKKGVLLFNTSLTSRVQLPNKHIALWKPFTNYVFNCLNSVDDLVWVRFGENDYTELLDNPTHLILTVPELPVERDGVWDSGDVFQEINKFFLTKQKAKIVW
jgi:uracil-DNA glycosylase